MVEQSNLSFRLPALLGGCGFEFTRRVPSNLDRYRRDGKPRRRWKAKTLGDGKLVYSTLQTSKKIVAIVSSIVSLYQLK